MNTVNSMDTVNDRPSLPAGLPSVPPDNSSSVGSTGSVRGRRVSRAEAIHIAKEIMRRAEEGRVAAVEAEAQCWFDTESFS